MKIVCESCGAKYSIADEKVAGRTFKIRCKRCSAPIVVHGEAVAAAADGGAGVAAGVASATGGDPSPAAPDPNAVWHAVVQGEQQGPMTQQALEGLVKAGTLDGDGYVWREGFDGWLPVRDVPELAGMLTGGAPAPSPSPAAPDPVAGSGAAAAENADGGNPAYAGAAFGAADTGTPLASRATRDDGADLFAPADPAANPFAARAGGDDASADDDVIASAPSSPRPTGASNPNLTGQRNENSVLFSLQNLQALATGPGGGGGAAPAAAGSGTASPAPARAPAPLATGGGLAEGSGLIDIRALASATSALGGTPDKEQDAKKVDDLLSIGGAGPGLGASSLGTPVLAPAAEPEKNNKATLALAVLGGFVVLAAAIVAGAYIFKPEPAIVQAPATTTGTQPAGQGDPPNTAAAPDDGDEEKGEAAAGDAAEDGEGGGEEADAKDGDKDSRGSRSGRRSRSRSDSDGARAGSSPSGGRSSGSSGGRRGDDIDSLLEGALGGGRGGSKTAKAAPAEDLPETPSREQAMRALRSVEGAVKACADGQHGVAMTQVTVSGSNGRVSRAVVQGQFAGTPQGSCVARAVRRARFPRFTRSTFQVTFPYRL